MRVEVRVETWGDDCGPRPQATSVGGGQTVEISEQGDNLVIAGRTRRTTRSCFSDNREVRFVSTSHSANTWRTICRTPSENPRQETGTYSFSREGEDRLVYREESRYNWQLNGSRCVASISGSQTYQRVPGEPTPTTEEPGPQETETPPAPACTPGPLTRLVVRPQNLTLAPEERVCFSLRREDGAGCARTDAVSAVLSSPTLGALRAQGASWCFVAGNTRGEGQIQFTSGAISYHVPVAIRQLDLSDLIARRAEMDGFVESPASSSASSGAALAVRTSGDSSVVLWVGLAAGVLVFLGLILAVRSRQSKRKPTIEPAPVPVFVPLPPKKDRICPTCRRGYTGHETQCESDGTELVDYKTFTASQNRKKCPKCGTEYDSSREFCGKDGAALV